MSSRWRRPFSAVVLVLVATFASEQVSSQTNDDFYSRLPAAELAKIESDASTGNIDALYFRYLLFASRSKEDTVEIAELREHLAAVGHPAAQSVLCLLQSLSEGEAQSTDYCFKAALKGETLAQSWLGFGLSTGSFGLKEDDDTALSYYRLAAFQGSASALSALGDAYFSADGVGKDNALAVHFWERAASLDDASSLRELGRSYALGEGVGQDIDKALKHLNRAADLGDGAAQYYAGLIYSLKENPLAAHVMFALSVKNLSPSEMRDKAIKARADEEKLLNKADLQRARAVVSNWKKTEPRPQPFIGGTEFVTRLQTALNERGYDVGTPDGLAGSKTRTAYRSFAETLGVGELRYDNPDIYYVAYRLNLFGKAEARPNLPETSTVKVDPTPANIAASGAEGAVKSGGSGFIVNEAGYVVTNAHVVKGCNSVRVVQGLSQRAVASVEEVSEFSDLAILKAELLAPKPVSFASGTGPKLGESIVVFGFPLTGVLTDQGNLTVGNLTALSGLRGDPSTLQISAPVQPGNSGGPVLDSKGQLIGIVVSKLNAIAVAGVTDDIPQNVNFAIRATVLENLLQSRSITYVRGEAEESEMTVTDLAEKAKNATVMVECVGP